MNKFILLIFWIQILIYAFLIAYFLVPVSMRSSVFPFFALSGIVFSFLGIILVYLTKKQGIQGWLRKFLQLTGVCSAGVTVSVILHNLFYALAVLSIDISVFHFLFEILHTIFFLATFFVFMIGFLIGAIGSIVLFIKK